MKKYWYIRHKDYGPLKVCGGGSFTCGKWEGFLNEITDVTIFPKKN